MMEAEDAIEVAAFGALTTPAMTGTTVYQHVPQDTAPPVTVIGDMDSEPLGGKGDTDEKVSLTIVTVFEGEQRKPLRAIQQQIKARLNNKTITANGWTMQFIFAGSDGVLLEDGETYVGNSRFTVLAISEA